MEEYFKQNSMKPI